MVVWGFQFWGPGLGFFGVLCLVDGDRGLLLEGLLHFFGVGALFINIAKIDLGR